MDVLNNREIAIAIWFGAFAIWALSNADVRKAFRALVDAFSTKSIVIPFTFLLVHTVISAWLLSLVALWEPHQIKNTVFWFFSVAIVSFFRLPKISEEHEYFKNAIKDNLKVIVFLEFIFSVYTFNLLVELIFVPFMALIGGMLAVSQNNEKYEVVEKLLNRVLVIIGWIIVFFTAYKLTTEFSEFTKEQTLFDFSVPVLLSLLLLPYIYFLHVYISYENIFTRLQFLIKDKNILAYAKKRAAVSFYLKTFQLKRWADSLHHENINTQLDVDNSIAEIKRLIVEEKNPPTVPIEMGWSPYQAASFLDEEGLKTGYYKKFYDNEWFASSPYLEIGSGLLPNNIAFYLEGDSKSVKRLKLKININEKAEADVAHQALLRIASRLHKLAVTNEINGQISSAILNGGNEEIKVKSKIICVSTEYWTNNNGYEVGFVIESI